MTTYALAAPAAPTRRLLLPRRSPAADDRSTAQFLRYAAVGTSTTLAYLILYRLLAPALGVQAANLAALLSTTVVSTMLHRHVTFPHGDTKGRVRQHAEALLALAIPMTFTYVTLAVLHGSGAGYVLETAGLLVATTLAGLARYGLLRSWVFAPRVAAFRCTCSPRCGSAGQPEGGVRVFAAGGGLWWRSGVGGRREHRAVRRLIHRRRRPSEAELRDPLPPQCHRLPT